VFKFLSDFFEEFDLLDQSKPIDLTDERAHNRAEGLVNESEPGDDDGSE